MNVPLETRGEVTILQPEGRLDTATAVPLEAAVIERLQAGCNRLVFDLSRIDYISSAGLRVILLAGKKLRATQGTLVLCGLREEVRAVFEMSGFLDLFACTPDLDGAMALA